MSLRYLLEELNLADTDAIARALDDLRERILPYTHVWSEHPFRFPGAANYLTDRY